VNGAGAEFHQVAGHTAMPNRCLGFPAKFPRFRLDGGLLIGVCRRAARSISSVHQMVCMCVGAPCIPFRCQIYDLVQD
jgi:hypothetical protein